MTITNDGYEMLCDALVDGAGFTRFNEANAQLGVGNGTTAESAAHEDLQGGSKSRKGMDSGFPTVSGNTMTFRASWGTAEANFDWQEVGLFNDPSATTNAMFNRWLDNIGTKSSSVTRQLTAEITLAAS